MAHSIHDFVTEIWIGTVFGMVEKRSRSCRTDGWLARVWKGKLIVGRT